MVHNAQHWKHVPAICDRKVIVKGYHVNLWHIGVPALLNSRDGFLVA